MKVIFLDIDGVLNITRFGEDLYRDTYIDSDLALDSGCIGNLISIVKRSPDIKIVWSTDWRNYGKPVWNGRWKNPVMYLEKQDFMKGRVIGKTPCKLSSEHFHDIKWWLDDNPDVKDYVILEDSYFPDEWFGLEKHIVRCDPSKGLTASDAGNALKILGYSI